jgi:hypothetical protein
MKKLLGIILFTAMLGLLMWLVMQPSFALFEDGSFILGHVNGCLPFSLCTIGG